MGYLTRHEDVKQSLARRLGTAPLSIAVALKAFDKALGHQGYLLIANVDWDVALSGFPTIPGRLAALKTSSQTKPQADSTDFREQIRNFSPEEVAALVLELAREEAALVLNMEVGQIPLDRSLQSLGLDSLMAVELAAGLEQRTGVNLPVMLFSDSPTLEIVSQRITARLTGTTSLEETNADAAESVGQKESARTKATGGSGTNADEHLLQELARRHAENLDAETLQSIMQEAGSQDTGNHGNRDGKE